jgi:hypothetical protein
MNERRRKTDMTPFVKWAGGIIAGVIIILLGSTLAAIKQTPADITECKIEISSINKRIDNHEQENRRESKDMADRTGRLENKLDRILEILLEGKKK